MDFTHPIKMWGEIKHDGATGLFSNFSGDTRHQLGLKLFKTSGGYSAVIFKILCACLI